MSASTQTARSNTMLRWSIILAFALVAFFASYRFAVAASGSSQGTGNGAGAVSAPAGAGGSGAVAAVPAGGGGCCGGGGPAITKAAELKGGIQTIAVDLSSGSYNPNTIELKAGVPAEISFGQASGCTGIVQSQQLGFSEDLSSGPKTVKIAALQPGTYQFACGMNMVTGTIVVK